MVHDQGVKASERFDPRDPLRPQVAYHGIPGQLRPHR